MSYYINKLNGHNQPFVKVRKYIWALSLYFFIVPLDAIKIFENFSFMRFLALVPLFLAFLQRKKLKATNTSMGLIIFLAIILLAVSYSLDPAISLRTTFSIATNAGIVFLLSCFEAREEDIYILESTLLASSWFAALLIILTNLTSISETGRMSISIGNSAQDANYVCGYLLFAMAYHSSQVIKGKRRNLNLGFLSFFMALLFLTGSRGGLLAGLVTILTVLLSNGVKKGMGVRTILLIFLLIGLFLNFLPYIVDFLPEAVSDRFSIDAVIKDKGTGRTVLWQNVISAFLEAPFIRKLFGYGMGSSVIFTWNNYVAHNMWLEYLIGIGCVGLIVIFLFYYRLIRISWINNRLEIMGTIMGYMTMSMSMSIMFYKPLWNITLLILMLERCEKYESLGK